MSLLRTLALACVAAWLGVMAFFSFAVAPLVFRTVDRAVAGQAVAAVLPQYYAWGVALGGVALVASVIQAVVGRAGRGRPLAGAMLAAAMLGFVWWAATVVAPQAEAARRARDDRAFAHAHRASVRLNALTMAAAAAFVALEALSPRGRRPR